MKDLLQITAFAVSVFMLMVLVVPSAGPINTLVISADCLDRASAAPANWKVVVVRSPEELLLTLRSLVPNAKVAVAMHGDSKGLRIKGQKRWHWDSYQKTVAQLGLTVYQISCLGKGKAGYWDGKITQVGNVKYLGTKGEILWYGLENLNNLPD